MKLKLGKTEGSTCNRLGCTGIIEIEDTACTCPFISYPPCDACTSTPLACNYCTAKSRKDDWDSEPEFTDELEPEYEVKKTGDWRIDLWL